MLDNALKFHGEAPPKIHLSARRDGAWWEFCIEDHGIDLSFAVVQSDDLNVSDPDDGESGEWKVTFGIKKNISFE